MQNKEATFKTFYNDPATKLLQNSFSTSPQITIDENTTEYYLLQDVRIMKHRKNSLSRNFTIICHWITISPGKCSTSW